MEVNVKRHFFWKLSVLGSCIALFLLTGGCRTTNGGIQIGWGEERKGGPPPHAPAHGYRAKHSYRYYPCSEVYFDISRKVYFYLEGSGWKMSVSLPRALRVELGDYVNIETVSDRPYTEHAKHKKQYPPGQMKKSKKNKKW